MKAKDIRGMYAIIPTPARPAANALNACNTVDLHETERLVNRLISDGVSGLIALGTTGECATLSSRDYKVFVECVLQVTARRVPTFIGTTALSGHDIAERLQFVLDRGADGTLLGLPMWQPMTDDMAIHFFREVAELVPKLGVMVYANTRAFRYAFPDLFWEAIAKEAPNVIAAKMSRPKDLPGLLKATCGRINIVPNEMTVQSVHAQAPEAITACWATAASMGPTPVIALMEAILRGDNVKRDYLVERIAWANETVTPIIRDQELFAITNIQLEKVRINAAGYCNAGPIRPPYDRLAPEHRQAAEECGRRWAQLCDELAAKSLSAPLHEVNCR